MHNWFHQSPCIEGQPASSTLSFRKCDAVSVSLYVKPIVAEELLITGSMLLSSLCTSEDKCIFAGPLVPSPSRELSCRGFLPVTQHQSSQSRVIRYQNKDGSALCVITRMCLFQEMEKGPILTWNILGNHGLKAYREV